MIYNPIIKLFMVCENKYKDTFFWRGCLGQIMTRRAMPRSQGAARAALGTEDGVVLA